jgi:hypothetical protein
MPTRDILFPMMSYPTPPANGSIEKAVAMAAGLGAPCITARSGGLRPPALSRTARSACEAPRLIVRQAWRLCHSPYRGSNRLAGAAIMVGRFPVPYVGTQAWASPNRAAYFLGGRPTLRACAVSMSAASFNHCAAKSTNFCLRSGLSVSPAIRAQVAERERHSLGSPGMDHHAPTGSPCRASLRGHLRATGEATWRAYV